MLKLMVISRFRPRLLLPAAALVCLSMTTTGCTNLLPRDSADIESPFKSYEEARDALEKVTPYQTTVEQLRQLGFDIHASANVRLIPYPETVTRLTPNPNVSLDVLDPGLRDCILAQQACRTYAFTMGHQRRHREGSFLLDFLNFRRVTETTGWRFEGLIVVRDGIVLFRSAGGEPKISRTTRQTNPLGPFQPGAGAAGSLLNR
jgi:hypothetical protein